MFKGFGYEINSKLLTRYERINCFITYDEAEKDAKAVLSEWQKSFPNEFFILRMVPDEEELMEED